MKVVLPGRGKPDRAKTPVVEVNQLAELGEARSQSEGCWSPDDGSGLIRSSRPDCPVRSQREANQSGRRSARRRAAGLHGRDRPRLGVVRMYIEVPRNGPW